MCRVVCAVQDGGKAAANDLVRSFNFTEEHYRTLSTVSLSDLQEAKVGPEECGDETANTRLDAAQILC